MKHFKKLFLILFIFSFSASTFAKDEHDHKKESTAGHEADDIDGKDAEHDHEEGENLQIGPGKGIVSANEKDGFQISPEAEKSFEIERKPFSALESMDAFRKAIVTAGNETNIYRYRNKHYKRIDFELVGTIENPISVRSKELKAGDEIVINGMGFLRIAEIAAFGGAPEGHSH